MVVGVKWYLHVVLMCISLIIMMLSTFSCASVYLLGEMPVQNHYLCFYYCVVSVIYFRYKFLFTYMIFNYFPPFCRLSVHFLDYVLCSSSFNSDIVQFIFFVFVACDVFDVISKKPFPNLRHEYLYLHFFPRVLQLCS